MMIERVQCQRARAIDRSTVSGDDSGDICTNLSVVSSNASRPLDVLVYSLERRCTSGRARQTVARRRQVERGSLTLFVKFVQLVREFSICKGAHMLPLLLLINQASCRPHDVLVVGATSLISFVRSFIHVDVAASAC